MLAVIALGFFSVLLDHVRRTIRLLLVVDIVVSFETFEQPVKRIEKLLADGE